MDVFIPAHSKDLAVLPWCVQGLRRYLAPAPSRIVLIPDRSDALPPATARRLGVEVLPESAFTDLTPVAQMPRIVVKSKFRSGWYFQQFLKWEARRWARGPRYLVMDADTVLIAPLVVEEEASGRPILDQGCQYHLPYFATYAKLFGAVPPPLPSFIINYMAFDVAWLDEMIASIHQRFPGRHWHATILDLIDREEMSSFSEFETYGYWLAEHKPGAFVRGACSRNLELRVRARHFHRWHAWRAQRQACNSVSYHNHRR
jgi:hypothetical protein